MINMPLARFIVPRIVSFAFVSIGIYTFAFLAFWYFEVVLWIVLGPFAFSSTYLGLRLWNLSPKASRALIYWATSVAWVLALVLSMFKDVTAIGGSVAVAMAALIVFATYRFIQKQR
jgi:hypothetical protein